MRIVSGRFGGRILEAPKGRDIRPTSDKIRGAIFNILRSRIKLESAMVMDVFCGTGALGLEALSQGAAFCIFVDGSKDSINLTRRNIAFLDVEKETKILQKDAAKIGAKPENISAASLVFLDPPYGQDLIPAALESLHNGNWLASNALCVIEEEKKWEVALPPGFTLTDERIYGDTKIVLAEYQPRTPV